MTIWELHLSDSGSGPIYRAILNQLESDIAAGTLLPGDRLPTHRDLAERLGVTVGTVSRAYAEAKLRCLVSGEVGRGTFVRGVVPGGGDDGFVAMLRGGAAKGDQVDLSLAVPPLESRPEVLRETLTELANRPDLSALLGYQAPGSSERQRATGVRWIERIGGQAKPEEVVMTSGAQNAIAVVLSVVARPGDCILCEDLTYPGVKWVADLLQLRLIGVEMDSEGMISESFDAACRREAPRAVYCTPTVQNPTAAVMSQDRRREIAAIARRHDVWIVEDDIYRAMFDDAPKPLSDLVRDRSFFITSLSKSLAPALRVGWVRGPESASAALTAAVCTNAWMVSPLLAEAAAILVDGIGAEKLLDAKRDEMRARSDLLYDIFRHITAPSRDGAASLVGPRGALHFWLNLPEPWRAHEFAAQAESVGIVVTPADSFAVGRADVPHGVRLCLGAPASRSELAGALRQLGQILDAGPSANPALLI